MWGLQELQCSLVTPGRVGSSWTRDQTSVLALAGGFLTTQPPGKPSYTFNTQKFINIVCGFLNLCLKNPSAFPPKQYHIFAGIQQHTYRSSSFLLMNVYHCTQWEWIWANSRRLWRTEPDVLQSMGLQTVWHDLAIEHQPFHHYFISLFSYCWMGRHSCHVPAPCLWHLEGRIFRVCPWEWTAGS